MQVMMRRWETPSYAYLKEVSESRRGEWRACQARKSAGEIFGRMYVPSRVEWSCEMAAGVRVERVEG